MSRSHSRAHLTLAQVPLRVLKRLLQFGGARCVHTHQTLEDLAQASQAHRQVEPVEPMQRVGTQVALQLAQTLLAVREEHEFLVVLQVLPPEHRGQVPPRLRVVTLDEAEALGRPVCRDRLAHDGHEVGRLALPVA